MSLFDQTNVYADIASCHNGNYGAALTLIEEVTAAGIIPKIQLFSEITWSRSWTLPERFVASVFRPEDVDFIMPHKPLALKIASVEATYIDLLLHCRGTDVPLIVSTGGLDKTDLLNLIDIVGEHDTDVCLMHCVSLYPTPLEQINLGRLAALGELIDQYAPEITLGWSSHWPVLSLGALGMAYAFGATQFEFHVKRDVSPVSPDEQSALNTGTLSIIPGALSLFEKFYGSDDLAGPDREAVLKWRQRWQSKTKG